MKITATKASPFARKTLMTIRIKGLEGRVQEVAEADAAAVYKSIRGANPLYRIPTMLLDDGTVVQDSHVICEYLDLLKAEPRIIPADPMERIRVLTLASLADGLIEAALTIVMEWRFRPQEKWVQSWLDRQQAKIVASLVWFEENLKPIGATPNYGEITTACALGYLDFRHKGAWRAKHPKLAQWLADFDAKVPAFGETMPKD